MSSIWDTFHSLVTIPPVFLAFAFMIKCLLISLYSILLYGVVSVVRVALSGKMGVRAKYYSWYTLLLSFPLAGLSWNDLFKVWLYDKFGNTDTSVFLGSVALLWFLLVLAQLVSRVSVNHRVTRPIMKMKEFPDNDSLKQQAASAVGLDGEKIRVVVSNAIFSPVSYGVFQKNILLPQDYDSKYTAHELYLLLLHEMVHLKNKDTLKIQLFGYAESFVWVFRLFYRSFKRDTELLCDNRVIGIEEEQRSLYGELLLKESAGKAPVKGLAFSDSYRMISKRLHALYDYHPEKHKTVYFATIILTIVVLGFCWSSLQRSSWFDINNTYNSEFELSLEIIDPLYGETSGIPAHILLEQGSFGDINDSQSGIMAQPFPQDYFDGLYEISDGEIRIDKMALYEAILPFCSEGLEISAVTFESTNYSLRFYNEGLEKTTLTFESVNHALRFYQDFDVNIMAISQHSLTLDELASADETNRYFTEPLRKRGIDEFLYLIAAHFA